jgi:predicted HicB family RNase H-like nuclease
MQYKGYQGVVGYDEVAKIFSGEVINTREVITFQGRSVQELERAFQESEDDYLTFCKSRDEEPEKPLRGRLLARIPPAYRPAEEKGRQGGLATFHIFSR